MMSAGTKTTAGAQAVALALVSTPDPAFTLPTVRVAVQSAMFSAGLCAWLSSAGFDLQEDADVLVIDDRWLDDPGALADAPAVVALGSARWASVLPEVVSGGYAVLGSDAAPAELLAGILSAAAGLAAMPPELLLGVSEPTDDPDDLSPALPEVLLTPRERGVLGLLAAGLSNKRAAKELGISESTIKFHVQAIYSKLNVQSRAGAVMRGMALGLVSV